MIPLYKLGILYGLRPYQAALICLSIATSPFYGTVLGESFRIESLIPFSLFLFLWTWESKKRLFWFLSAILLLSTKEDQALYLCTWGLAQLLCKPRRKESIALIALSITVFLINIKVAQPFFLGSKEIEPGYLKFWQHYGDSLFPIIVEMLSSPFTVALDIATSGWWKIYLVLLGLPFLSLRYTIAAIPGVIILGTASSYPAMHDYGHYYPLTLACLAIASMARVWSQLPSTGSLRHLVVFSIVSFPLFGAGWIKIHAPDWNTLSHLENSKQYLETHHPNSIICAQTAGFPHLGYALDLRPLSEDCLRRDKAVALWIRNHNPYPHTQTWLQSLEEQFTNTKKERFGSIIVGWKSSR